MITIDPIPFLDLVTPHRELEAELLQVMRTALGTASFIGGRMLSEFEESFAQFSGSRFCIGVGSGTDALRIALLAGGIGRDDVVITVPNTFIATTEAISQTGALPAFVDVNERTYNMDPEKLREYLECFCIVDETSGRLIDLRSGRRVAGIIPVHLCGQMADMDPILTLAAQYSLVVIEDACQAHGAEYFSRKYNRWFKAGSMGRAAAFSFYPGKNLGACGEAGAITTNDEKIACRARVLRDHGQAQKYFHECEGYNARLDAIQAGILNVKLGFLTGWNQRRRRAAEYYRKLMRDQRSLLLPFEPEWSRAVYHLFVVQTPCRDSLMSHLAARGIGTAIHYPVPLHLQNAYARLGFHRGDFPVAEAAAKRIVSLPMFAELTPSQQQRISDELNMFVVGSQGAMLAVQ